MNQATFNLPDDSSSILDSLSHVIDIYIFTKDFLRIAVAFRNWCTSETNKGSIRQSLTHQQSKSFLHFLCLSIPVFIPILRTMGFIRDNNDILSFR